MAECVPYGSLTKGDVVDGANGLAVITFVGTEQDGTRVILSVSADGGSHRLEWLPGITPGLVKRIGRDCEPTVKGVRGLIGSLLDKIA